MLLLVFRARERMKEKERSEQVVFLEVGGFSPVDLKR